MDSDSEKENYFSLYMKRKKNENKKKENYDSNKKLKKDNSSLQTIKEEHKKRVKLLLESSEKKNKSTFSFIKSYLFNFQEQDKKGHRAGLKNFVIDKQKLKNVRVNKSSTDINRQANINKGNDKKIEYEKYENELSSKHKNGKATITNNKIENLKNRIFNLMNIIDDFEKEYIYNSKPVEIKDQLNKINMNMNIISHNMQLNKKNKNNCNIINDKHFITDRTNYNQNKNIKNNKKNFMKLNEDLDICNYYDNDNKILTQRINSNKKKRQELLAQRLSIKIKL
jgi:hypothetical protein